MNFDSREADRGPVQADDSPGSADLPGRAIDSTEKLATNPDPQDCQIFGRFASESSPPAGSIADQFGSIMDHSAVGMALLDPNGRFLRLNRALCQMLAASQDDLIGTPFHAITHPADLAANLREVRKMLDEGTESYQTEKRYIRRDGQILWAITSVALVRKPDGKPSHFIKQIQDITKRKAAEERVEVQSAALKAAANGIVITDRDGVIEWVNDAFCRLTGYALEEALGKKPGILRSGEHSPEFYRQLWETILAGRVWHGEVVNRRKDGTTYPEEMTITPVYNCTGVLTHFIAIKQNITERKQAQKQMLRTQRLESIGTLAGGIAHDLNNSLAPILMCVELLKMQYPDADKVLDTVETSARRAAGMVRQLVTFAKGAEGERLLVQPRHLLKEISKIILSTFPKNIVVKCEYPADLPMVLGDATQLHQVLLNLCVNARDAMPGGGSILLKGSVEDVDHPTGCTSPDAQPGKYVVLSVRDTGTGIAPEVLDRMWEPFFTTKGPEKGTGLGLSTVLGIAKGHAGFVRVTSTPGDGACFSVCLPAHSTASGNTDFVTNPDSDFLGDNELILVVDDEADVRSITRAVLERLRFKVITACDGADGIVRAADHREGIRVVITDLQMPHMDGIALIRALRRMLPRTSVVVSCGKLEASEQAELRDLGVRVFLEKPFSESRLKEALKQVLALKG